METIAEGVNVLLCIVISGLAGYQVADTWVRGSLFEQPQQWLRKRSKTNMLAKLFSCLFCLSHWTALTCLLVMLLTGWDSLVRIPVYWFAAVKISLVVQREVEIELDETEEVDNIEIMDE